MIGSWSNDFDKVKDEKLYDSKGAPFSYNIMPLPQIPEQPNRGKELKYPDQPPGPKNPQVTKEYGGFILKNFAFTETIRFNGASPNPKDPSKHDDPAALAVIAGAPNRGGGYTQFSHAVFYDQQVHFAEGPLGPNGKLQDPKNKNLGDIVHVENGAWLHLSSEQQDLGPYRLHKDDGPFVSRTVLRQPPYITIAKQIAVPHGNSVLALGNFDALGSMKVLDDKKKPITDPATGRDKLKPIIKFPGAPAIPDAFVPFPAPADVMSGDHTNPYDRILDHTNDFENPSIERCLNANKPLQDAVKKIKPTSFIHWRVTTLPLPDGEGVVTNIPFEDRKSKVTEYWADYWLLSTDPKFDPEHPEKNDNVQYDYLVYNQVILMEMDVYIGDLKKKSPSPMPTISGATSSPT